MIPVGSVARMMRACCSKNESLKRKAAKRKTRRGRMMTLTADVVSA